MPSGTPEAILADTLIGMMRCQRILQGSRSTLRQPPGATAPATDIFDNHAIWPVIGHISWLFSTWQQAAARFAATDFTKIDGKFAGLYTSLNPRPPPS